LREGLFFFLFKMSSLITLRTAFPGTAGGGFVGINSASATAILNQLIGSGYSKLVAQNKFGFRAYNQLAQRRAYAIQYPADYLDAKRMQIVGGTAPAAVGTAANGAAIADALYGTHGAAIPGVAGDVANIYSSTLKELYDAGADEKTADEYATRIANAVMQSKLAVVEAMYPPIYDSASEKNLMLNTLGNVGNRAALTAPKLKGIGYK